MSIPVIDTLKPAGRFPLAEAEDIDCNGTPLDEVLDSKATPDKVAEMIVGKANAADVERELDKKDEELAALDIKKVDKVSGKGLSTNDYTNEEKAKVSNAVTEVEKFNSYFRLIKGGNSI